MQAPAELGRVLATLLQIMAGDGLVQAAPQVLKAMRAKRVSGMLRFLAMALTCNMYVEEYLNPELFSPLLRPRVTGQPMGSLWRLSMSCLADTLAAMSTYASTDQHVRHGPASMYAHDNLSGSKRVLALSNWCVCQMARWRA